MDNFKNIFKRVNSNSENTDYTVRMSDLKDRSILTSLESHPVIYTSTLNSEYNLSISSTNSTKNDSLVNDENLTMNASSINDRLSKSCDMLNGSSRDSPEKQEGIPISKPVKSASTFSVKQPHRNNSNLVPIMGKSALLLVKSPKQNPTTKESVIIHDLVTKKFNTILHNFQNRNLKRRASRLYSEGCSSTDSNSDLNHPKCKSPKNDLSIRSSDEDNKFGLDSTIETDKSISFEELSLLISKVHQSTQAQVIDYMKANEYTKKISKEIIVQNQILKQITKALQFCKSTKEFVSGIEQIEAEKILLIASIKKERLVTELNKIDYNDKIIRFDLDCLGDIKISSLEFPIKKYYANVHLLNEQRKFLEYFICIASHSTEVLASEIVSEVKNGTIRFQKLFSFSGLHLDFEVDLSIYCMRIKKASIDTVSHETKFHLNKKSKICPSPKQLFSKVQKYKLINDAQDSYFPSSFTLWGTYKLSLPDMKLKCFQGKMFDTLSNSNLLGNIFAKIQTHIELTNKISGFLTIAVKQEHTCATWNRRWCVLDGFLMKYWNYPSEEESFFNPIGEISLKKCIVESVEIADRSICAKPKTLMLPILLNSTIQCFFLSADSHREMNNWKNQFNLVLHLLNSWNCLD